MRTCCERGLLLGKGVKKQSAGEKWRGWRPKFDLQAGLCTERNKLQRSEWWIKFKSGKHERDFLCTNLVAFASRRAVSQIYKDITSTKIRNLQPLVLYEKVLHCLQWACSVAINVIAEENGICCIQKEELNIPVQAISVQQNAGNAHQVSNLQVSKEKKRDGKLNFPWRFYLSRMRTWSQTTI